MRSLRTCAVAAAVAVFLMFSSPSSASDNLVVSVTLNSESKGDVFVTRTDDGDFLLKAEDLRAMGLKAEGPLAPAAIREGLVSLRSLEGLSYSLDEKTLVLTIAASPRLLGRQVIDLMPRQRPGVLYPRENSAFLNYGLAYYAGAPLGFQSFSVTDTLGARSGDVLFLSDSVYTKTQDNDQFVRLMSSAVYERRGDLQWFTIGDQFASSGDLGSTVNLGGVGFAKIYRMDPYFVKQPSLGLSGSAAIPSQAEIYLDGVLVGREKIAPGEFELKNFYYYGGAHTVEVVMRDAFGNERRISYPMYFTDTLLRRGLHEYSYNAGVLREQYGTLSNEYGKPVLSLFHRYGVTDSVNLGVRAEASDRLYNGGMQGAVAFPSAGVVTVGLAKSSLEGRGGGAGSFSYGFQKSRFSAGLIVRGYTEGYAVVGAPPSLEKARYEGSAGAGFSTIEQGALSLDAGFVTKYSGEDRTATSLTYSRNLARSMVISATLRLVREAGSDYEFLIGLTYYPAKDYQASARYQHSKDADVETMQYQKNTPTGEGISYRATLERSDSDTVSSTVLDPFIQYNGRYGIYSADARLQHINGENYDSYAFTASGSVVYAGGAVGLSRPVNDSFGIVTVAGLRDVVVRVNNEDMGSTDSSGRLIIPSLKSYYHNEVTLDPTHIPMDYQLSEVRRDISPSQWSGSCIGFDAVRMQAVTGRLFVKRGDKREPLEFYQVTMNIGGRTLSFPTGKGGEFYFETTPDGTAQAGGGCRGAEGPSAGVRFQSGRYRASAEAQGRRCTAEIILLPSEDVIIDVGEVECAP